MQSTQALPAHKLQPTPPRRGYIRLEQLTAATEAEVRRMRFEWRRSRSAIAPGAPLRFEHRRLTAYSEVDDLHTSRGPCRAHFPQRYRDETAASTSRAMQSSCAPSDATSGSVAPPAVAPSTDGVARALESMRVTRARMRARQRAGIQHACRRHVLGVLSEDGDHADTLDTRHLLPDDAVRPIQNLGLNRRLVLIPSSHPHFNRSCPPSAASPVSASTAFAGQQRLNLL